LKDVTIIGGGLAGLTNAIILAKAGLDVVLVEKKQYPFHRVCGEYVSNEALPFLKSLGIDPYLSGAATINKLVLSTPGGRLLETPLGMGGFGLSRYVLDDLMYKKAIKAGVDFRLKTSVNEFHYLAPEDAFDISLSDGTILKSRTVIGAFGKRSTLDRQLDRPFFKKRSPYVGIKYHIKADFPAHTIALHIFKDGYCGINDIEDNRVCLCYLTTRDNLKNAGTIPQMEKDILYKNPYLKTIVENAEMLYDKPEVINEISFASKESVVDHALMCGDAAGMIAPLCGNGMAMAIHAAKICSAETIAYFNDHHNRARLEQQYTSRWQSLFSARLTRGRLIQKLFNKPVLLEPTVGLANTIPAFSRWVVGQTHGEAF
jgi:flavin-dependent dehydrogenase